MSRVLNRALGQVPDATGGIRPRRVSIFEPVPEPERDPYRRSLRPIPTVGSAAQGTAAPGAHHPEGQHEAVQHPAAYRPGAQPAGPQHAAAYSGAGYPDVKYPAARFPGEAAAPMLPTSAEPPLDRVPTAAPNATRGRADPTPQPIAALSSTSVEPTRGTPNDAQIKPVLAAFTARATEPRPVSNSLVTEPSGFAPGSVTASVRLTAVPGSVARPDRTPAELPLRPRGGAATSEPVVRISIGRLEIRGGERAAVAAPPARATAGARGTGPDLDDYLTRRTRPR